MDTPFKVVIVGAGIGGLSCAIACRLQGLGVEVLERAPKFEPVGAGIQIPPNAMKVLESYGLKAEVETKGIVVKAINFRRYENGELLASRSTIGEFERKVGGSWVVIHRADYHQILVEKARQLGVVISLGSHVTDIDVEQSVLSIGDEKQIKINADVIVGADGLWSELRNVVLKNPVNPTETGDLAYRGTFTRSQLLALNDNRITELCNQKVITCWLGPDKHSVFYPVRGGKEFNLVLLRPDNLPKGARTVKGDIDEMRDTFKGWDEILTKIISCIPSVLKWKLCHFSELESWTKGSTALLGDACHPTLPYQAQGAAMAVEDGAILGYLVGETVKKLRSENLNPHVEIDQIRSVLKLYEEMRKYRTTINVQGALANRDFYHMADGPAQQERDTALKAWDCDNESLPLWKWTDQDYQQDLLGYKATEHVHNAFQQWWETSRQKRRPVSHI
ncbi:putative salicylate hydroxylase [Xylogone sp. PMI_703]|nr:putative salicylate hydroxylase [Xylogone sp. PMI_703]